MFGTIIHIQIFNKKFYDSNDVIVTISKVTDDIVKTVAPDVESSLFTTCC